MPRLVDFKGFLPYLIVLFLNAFVDLGHKIIVQNTVFKIYDGQTQVVLTAIVNALILIPFVLLFSPAGFLSDKYPKNQVMRYSAWAAVAATLLITASYYAGWFWMAFALTLLLAIQSALYGPAKYGYIKELVGKEPLARANGVVQATTIIGILLGTFVFSGLFELYLRDVVLTSSGTIMTNIAPIGWILVTLAVIELIFAYRLPQKTQTNTGKTFSAPEYFKGRYLKRNLRSIRSKHTIWQSIIGLSVFWAISQVVLAAFPAFAKATLQEDNTLVIQGILACTGIGIMLGSIIAGRVSRNYIETGLIPLGAAGLTAALVLMPTLESPWTMGLTFLTLGVMGGLFIIPLNALIQFNAREDELGTVLAGNNWAQNVAMLSFLGLTVTFATFGLNSETILVLLAVVALVGTGHTVRQLPHSFARILVTALFKRRYKIDVVGFRNLPAQGAVLMLGNHISWIDWALVQIACPRPVRFVMQREIYNRWFLKPFLKVFGVVPIAKGHSEDALSTINDLLKQGEVVCLFPEGAISRNGQLGKFHSGYERAVEGVDGVILPFYLRGLWGSAFSRSNDKLRKARTPSAGRRNVIVAFGPTLSIATPVETLKQKVFELSISAWEQFTDTLPTVPLSWIKTAKRYGKEIAVVDSQGDKLSYRRMLTATVAFAKRIRAASPEPNIGIVLPASGANIIANMAVMFNGQTAVNLNYTASADATAAAIAAGNIRHIYTSRLFASRLRKRGIDIEKLFAGCELLYMEDIKASFSKAQLAVAHLKALLLPAGLLYRICGKRRKLDQPAAILFSSGSEGAPKGVVLSHRNIVANCKQISDVLNMREDDVMVGSLPPFHCFGLTVTSIMPVLEGLPIVCHPDPTDVLGVAKAIARHRATVLCGTATFLRLYAKNPKVEPLMLDSLRLVVAGAEKLNQSTREAFERKFSKTIYEGYGTTETTPVASVNVPDALDTGYWRVQYGNRPGSVGLPLPGTSFRVVDPDTLENLPLGENGLIMISGTQVMMGYLDDEEKTAQAIVELDGRRWYKTGDKGHISKEGFLTIIDRYSRFAKIGGEMVSLGAVEEKVKSILDSDEVYFVAVSMPDEKKGERIVLLMEGDTDPAEIRSRLIAGGIDNLLLPASIHKIEEIPRLGTGKTDYKGVAELVQQF
ncbi:acyl-[ACP]--phospholipid O-acyltransferase [Exilibacterium tricleocarpae]|uniref:Acyl-[ACP]--phospholipid O-acyltransferase n=1 Tax=Exilibacterium tricleocarpae TaxID=2591008 RepID=A0A545TFN3_9GAMM|nr:acyl-[ACP]--phospholipid O-acyltransferase [Exilibacterium tricleocarpae]TQV75991.1 acyl-[ACP]--phospholipid O-acyltransferase [Exilibacterium tricleocarpae]